MIRTKLLGNTGCGCCILGIGGMAGAIEFGTGLFTSITLLVIGAICLHLYRKEEEDEKENG